MSNLEHLIENTLVCIENKLPYEKILDFIKNDPNLKVSVHFLLIC